MTITKEQLDAAIRAMDKGLAQAGFTRPLREYETILAALRASEQRVVELEGLLNKSYNNLAHHHRCSLHRESDTRLLETIYKAISKTSISQSKEAP
jgi:hypothetical protein